MATKYPQHVARLFQAGPPVQYKKPVDYPIESRKTVSNISGLSGFLSHLKNYAEEFTQGSENRHLQAYDDADQKRQIENKKLRTELSEWKPHEDANFADTDPYRTIFVGRLPYSVTEVELQKLFVRFGDIEKVRVVRNKMTNKSRGYGFVAFKEEHSARSACREIGVHRGEEVEGRAIIVDIERGRTVKYFTPRRLGGGLGGRGYMKRDRMAKLAMATKPTSSASAVSTTAATRDYLRGDEGSRASPFPRSAAPPPPQRSRFSGYNNNTSVRAQGESGTGYRSRSSRTSRFGR
ncbi:LAME_0F13696g1_1 [Lachancea meyersii CBS 8951]|uniref:LAME_0F13696g1_1 n=1 Tax=Lachancea meyersii CBS 8951 TaxID=1266667 RepID=A0A1G4JXJ3_9SACH|nr:LAME_0F13696g1_1 [Lachancea meyersii CBS 8951]